MVQGCFSWLVCIKIYKDYIERRRWRRRFRSNSLVIFCSCKDPPVQSPPPGASEAIGDEGDPEARLATWRFEVRGGPGVRAQWFTSDQYGFLSVPIRFPLGSSCPV